MSEASLEGPWKRTAQLSVIVVGCVMFLFHMVSSQFAFLGELEMQNYHLAFALTLTFLVGAEYARSKMVRTYVVLMLALSLFVTGYVHFNMNELEANVGFPGKLDVVVGLLIMFVVIEATRLAWGIVLPIVAMIFVLYFFLGHHIPGALYHHKFGFDFVVSYLSIGLSGVYGSFLSVSGNSVFLFVVFGSLLSLIRVNDLFLELGKAAGRVLEGGPGQTAVVASSLVGMVTGAAVANVAVTGAFTIPFMKKAGYKPYEAGAIEATASTGGQIMPPVMGASAFLMASFMGVSYASVMAAALLPALLYYWCVMLGVQFISINRGVKAPKEKVDKRLLVSRLPAFLIPLTLLVVLLAMRYSPGIAAFWAIVVGILLSYVNVQTRPTGLGQVCKAIAEGSVVGAKIAVSLAVVGIMAQTLISTGLGNKIAGLVELLSGGNVVVALVLTMLVSIILGCGVPTSAAYALVAIIVVPTLIHIGVSEVSAHFFAFYFAVISAITPPVALAALAGAAISGAPYMRTSFAAFKLAVSGFIIPFLVVFNPAIVFNFESVEWAIGSAIAVPIGLTAFTALLYGCGLSLT